MSAICVISSRMNSKRFPGKPLEHINGREMILWVAASCKAAVGIENVYIATGSSRIDTCVTDAGYQAIRVDTDSCNNCSDATAEAVKGIDCDVVVDVQGDEPLITPDDIRRVIDLKRIHHDAIINTYVEDTHEKESLNSIKVITDGNHVSNLLYASRLPIPYIGKMYKRQVCIYGFYKEQLIDLYGASKPKGLLESREDVHILRCLDNNRKVTMVKLRGRYWAVDVPGDIKKVEDIING